MNSMKGELNGRWLLNAGNQNYEELEDNLNQSWLEYLQNMLSSRPALLSMSLAQLSPNLFLLLLCSILVSTKGFSWVLKVTNRRRFYTKICYSFLYTHNDPYTQNNPFTQNDLYTRNDLYRYTQNDSNNQNDPYAKNEPYAHNDTYNLNDPYT